LREFFAGHEAQRRASVTALVPTPAHSRSRPLLLLKYTNQGGLFNQAFSHQRALAIAAHMVRFFKAAAVDIDVWLCAAVGAADATITKIGTFGVMMDKAALKRFPPR
jgi:histidinol phosphatase-like enzyme